MDIRKYFGKTGAGEGQQGKKPGTNEENVSGGNGNYGGSGGNKSSSASQRVGSNKDAGETEVIIDDQHKAQTGEKQDEAGDEFMEQPKGSSAKAATSRKRGREQLASTEEESPAEPKQQGAKKSSRKKYQQQQATQRAAEEDDEGHRGKGKAKSQGQASTKGKKKKRSTEEKGVDEEPIGQQHAQEEETNEGHQKPAHSARKPEKGAPSQRGQPAEDAPWTEKYAPRTRKDLVGQGKAVNQLSEWLQKWGRVMDGEVQLGSSKDAPARATFLSGPPGIGKTSSAKLLGELNGFDVVEVNASDSRTKADAKAKDGIAGKLSNRIKEMVSNQGLMRGEAGGPKRQMLIMDEVDGMSGGDRGGLQDLVDTIKRTRVPIVCICNDKWNQKLRTLQNHAQDIPYSRPNKNSVKNRLREICQKEGLAVDDSALERLVEQSNNDMRVALNQLQMARMQSKRCDATTLEQSASKNVDMNVTSVMDRLFSHKYAESAGFPGLLALAFQDNDLVPLYVQENYVNYIPPGVKNDESPTLMQHMAQASLSISDSDLVNSRIRRQQQWSLLPYVHALGVVGPSISVRGRRVTFNPSDRNFHRFPAWLGKTSTTNKAMRLLNDLQCHAAGEGATVANATSVRLHYLPVLRELVLGSVKREGKEGIATAMAHLDDYNMTKEDFDAMLEVTKYSGEPDPLSKIPANTKSALTKELNRKDRGIHAPGAQPQAVSVSRGKKKSGKQAAAGPKADDDEEGEAEDNDEDEAAADDAVAADLGDI